jgi:hypothetical protein
VPHVRSYQLNPDNHLTFLSDGVVEATNVQAAKVSETPTFGQVKGCTNCHGSLTEQRI